jgi:hypothetical protein
MITGPESQSEETASVEFTVPNVTCTSSTDGETAIEYLVLNTEPVAYPAVIEACQSGSVSYRGQLAAGNTVQVVPFAVDPGDTVVLRGVLSSSVHFNVERMALKDKTTGESAAQGSGTTAVRSNSSVTIGVTDGAGAPNFGVIDWAHALVDGSKLTAQQLTQYYLVDSRSNGNQDIIATSSSISASGESFRTHWIRSF